MPDEERLTLHARELGQRLGAHPLVADGPLLRLGDDLGERAGGLVTERARSLRQRLRERDGRPDDDMVAVTGDALRQPGHSSNIRPLSGWQPPQTAVIFVDNPRRGAAR